MIHDKGTNKFHINVELAPICELQKKGYICFVNNNNVLL